MDERNKLNKNHIEPPAPLPNMRRDEIGVEEWFDERASVENEWNILRSTLKDMFSRESSPGISSVYIYNKNIIFQEEDFIFLFTFFLFHRLLTYFREPGRSRFGQMAAKIPDDKSLSDWLIYNGNCIRVECNLGWNHTRDFKIASEFDLKSHVWFQTKIARPEVQLPL